MKKMNILFLGVIILITLSSCTTPNPLTGTWADNSGNQLTLAADNTFSAKMYSVSTDEETTLYEGVYSIQLNAITFTITTPEKRVVSEWDIRGNILYLYWTDDIGETKLIELYKIA